MQLLAYPGCPTLSWIIASRVTNKFEDADALISFTGRKGSSKTTSSSALCEDTAENIARIRGKGEPPEKFFNISHVRSITEMGALELLSSGALTQENSVFLLDDTGTQWSSRNFQSPVNKTLNAILQICRIYKCVIVANFILQSHIDIQARGMADFRAEMQYKNAKEGYAVFKFYYLEQGVKKNNPHEYKKYLKWNGKRIKQWVIGRPSAEYEKAYKQMRQTNTDEFIISARQKVREILEKSGLSEEELSKIAQTEPIVKPKKAKMPTDYTLHPKVLDIRDKVLAIRNNPTLDEKERSDTRIAKKLGTTRYWVSLVP